MEVKIPETETYYRNDRGETYQVQGAAVNTETGKDMVLYQNKKGQMYVTPVEKFCEEMLPAADQAEEEQTMIMEFLDLTGSEEKVRYLQKKKLDLTDKFLQIAAQSLEFTENQDSLEMRYQDLIHYLKTLSKYEKRR